MSIITTWGSKPFERKNKYTCDSIITRHNGAYFRAVDIDAPSSLVFKWLCQMKVAPYSYDTLDNHGIQSPPNLTPDLAKLNIGDKMMTIFSVAHFIPNKEITLVMDVPPKPYDKYYVPTAITYRLLSNHNGLKNHTRLVVKYVAEWKYTLFGFTEKLLVVFADFIMMRRQLLNFKHLAEKAYLSK